MKDDWVLRALKALAENDLEKEAPIEGEARLFLAFRARRARSRRLRLGFTAMAAGVVIAAFLWASGARRAVVSAVAPSIPPVAEIKPPQPPPPLARTVPSPRRAASKVATARQAEPREVVTDFFPLMNPAPPFERGQMLRVELPAAAMQTVGLPVRQEHLADPIQADVLVGEDGMPRAIRFVRFDFQ